MDYYEEWEGACGEEFGGVGWGGGEVRSSEVKCS